MSFRREAPTDAQNLKPSAFKKTQQHGLDTTNYKLLRLQSLVWVKEEISASITLNIKESSEK